MRRPPCCTRWDVPCLQDLIAFTVPAVPAETKQPAFRLSLGLSDWPPKVGLMVLVALRCHFPFAKMCACGCLARRVLPQPWQRSVKSHFITGSGSVCFVGFSAGQAGRQSSRVILGNCGDVTSTPHLREISYVIRHSQKLACYLLFVHTHQNATLIRQSITKVRRCNWLKAG